ncbi:hypothetical protein MKK84_05355 [Methylobacterium sp. E-065]|uniref:hypothetical protein n=1 Tax=Methylobacterium sp. E-065 TaxID=2836583 RepID=UPI001FBAA00B|nr:hypothetical protein [Methylobacterium sp. E-065]MCJ2016859.1 hypothetical protein [Methylobacterium sp. E-065]
MGDGLDSAAYLDSRARSRHLELMDAGLTLAKLIGPIAAATILNVFLFAGAWRGHQTEMRIGKDPWWLGAGAVAYVFSPEVRWVGSYLKRLGSSAQVIGPHRVVQG